MNRRVVGVSGTRLYDATTNAAASDLSTHANLVGSQTLTLSGTGTIASKNVGSNKTVSIGTLALGDGTNGGLAANYTLTGGTHQLTVNQRPLVSSFTRFYDGTTTINSDDTTNVSISFNVLQGGENLTMNGTGTVSSKDVSAGSQSVTSVNLALADGTGGTAGLASNYSLSSSNLTINKKPINTVYLTRQYNASNSVAGSDLSSMTGLIGSETLTLSGSATMSSANVGTNTVNAALFTLGNGFNGGLANNYTVSGGNHTMVITQRPLNATLARQYDATTTAAGSTLSSFDALQGGETLTMSGSGTAASKDVANGIAMSSNGTLALVDGTGLASNYNLNSTVINISKRVLNSSGSKTYDANTDALASAITLSNLASTETLNHSGTASTSSANVGSYTISNLTGVSIADGTNGGLASNYTLQEVRITLL